MLALPLLPTPWNVLSWSRGLLDSSKIITSSTLNITRALAIWEQNTKFYIICFFFYFLAQINVYLSILLSIYTIHSFIHSFNVLFAHSFSHSFTCSLHPSIFLFIHSFVQSFISIYSDVIYSSFYPFPFIHSSIHSQYHRFAQLLNYWIVQTHWSSSNSSNVHHITVPVLPSMSSAPVTEHSQGLIQVKQY